MEIKDLSQVGEVLEKINTKQASIDTALAGTLSKKDIEGLQSDLKEVKTLTDSLGKIGEKGAEKGLIEFITNLQKQTDSQAEELKMLKNEGGQKGQSIEAELERMIKSDSFKNFKNGMDQTGRNAFQLKAATPVTTSNSFTQTASPIIPYMRDPLIGVEPRKQLVLQRLLSSRPAGMGDYVDWIERTTETSAAAMTAEGAAYAGGNTSDLGWTTATERIKKITDFALVSKEKLEDTDWVMSEISAVLNENIPFKLETELFDGNGVGESLNGILGASKFKTFAAPTGIAGKVDNANMYDALGAAMLQVELGNTAKAKGTGFICTAHLVNPVDWFLLSKMKDQDGQYLMGADGVLRVGGVPVVKSQFLTPGTYLSGDFTRGSLRIRKGLTIEMFNQHASYAALGVVTFLAEMRCALVVKSIDTFAFVSGTFDNTISAITTIQG